MVANFRELNVFVGFEFLLEDGVKGIKKDKLPISTT